MVEPEIGGAKPILVTLGQKDDTVFWCACGRSKAQPFCDGSHAGTPFRPVRYVVANDSEEVLFCACKRTRAAPFCDGSHNQLADGCARAKDEEISASADAKISPRSEGSFGRAHLDGGCFVFTPDFNSAEEKDGWRIIRAITRAFGADKLTQLTLAVGAEAPHPIRFGDSEVALFVVRGRGSVTISGTTFAVEPECAVSARPGEAISMQSADGAPVLATMTVCPPRDDLDLLDDMPDNFDARFVNRVMRVDVKKRRAMGDRFYQVLSDEKIGSGQVTQFIGEIPRSRAAAHRHLYEEAILILSGDGFLRTESARAEVRPGDVIYLPKKQSHSLECVSERGMRLAGAFYPAGSPAINY